MRKLSIVLVLCLLLSMCGAQAEGITADNRQQNNTDGFRMPNVGALLWNAESIEGVTQALYDSGVALIKSHVEDSYINELANIYRDEGDVAFTLRIFDDALAFDALMPEVPAENDALFISALQFIQGNIGNAILLDVTESDNGDEDSTDRWVIVNDAIAAVENATSAQELTDVLNGVRVTVATDPMPTPTPEPEVTYTTLSKGDKGDEVLEMQNRLYMLGFLTSDFDGAFGKNTQTAVKLFQQAAGLEPTGIADNATLQLLYSDDAPRTEYAQVTATPAP